MLPNDKLQLLLTVLVPVVCANVTRLKLTLLQLNVAVVPPSNVKVPELWVKVGVPDIVMAPARVVEPLEAVKLPALRVKVPFMSKVWFDAVKMPAPCTQLVVTCKVVARVMVPS